MDKRRILIVDANEELRTLLARVLSDLGHDVVATGNREEALAREDLEEFDLVISDLTDDAEGGIQVLSEVKRKSLLVPVVVSADEAQPLGIVNPERSNLFIALDEAFVNAVKHGNKYDTSKLVRITADLSAKEARFTIEDEGEGFKINEIPDPCDPANLFKSSGRGVLLIYNIMDEVRYNER